MHIAYAKASEWAKHNSFGKAWRLERMKQFIALVKPPSNAKIIDLGGHLPMWQWFEHDFEVTLVNLPGSYKTSGKVGKYTLVEGDATNLSDSFEDQSFDIVFSNSVIEHVGDESKQADFASEVMRLGKAYWVQTPSNYWPIEPHTGVIGYWLLPEFARQNLHKSWEKELPVWTEMIRGTRLLTRNRMRELFPDGNFYIERKLLLEKSYSAYKTWKADT
jgi:hypothetical protein